MRSTRTRNWSFIVYPDSVPFENWQEILKISYHVPMAISPLHDKDLNPTGDEKKAHWHVFMAFDSVKSFSQIHEITKEYNATIPQPVESPTGLIRYFIHKDNPEKFQYNWEDIKVFNGFDISNYDRYTKSQMEKLKIEIINFINDQCIIEYCDLVEWCADEVNEHIEDWSYIVNNNTVFFKAYIDSKRHKLKEWKMAQKI